MPAALVMRPGGARLVDEYREAIEAEGSTATAGRLWPAMAFAARVGRPEDWSALSVAEQCCLHRRIRSFVGWLMVTGRLTLTADYAVVGEPQLGRIAAGRYPATHALVTSTATSLGYSPGVAEDQWSLLARTAAMFGLTPDRVGGPELETVP